MSEQDPRVAQIQGRFRGRGYSLELLARGGGMWDAVWIATGTSGQVGTARTSTADTRLNAAELALKELEELEGMRPTPPSDGPAGEQGP